MKIKDKKMLKKINILVSGCDTVGKAIASDTRDPHIESSQWQISLNINYIWRDENKEKEVGKGTI